jgi:integrase
MASLQVRHQGRRDKDTREWKGCALGRQWTPVATLDEGRCDCSPTFYVVTSVGGKLIREKAGTDRAKAEERLGRVAIHLNEGDYKPPVHKRFGSFADEWVAGLQRRSTTVKEYETTLAYAKRAFGRRPVSSLTPADVRKMLTLIEADNREKRKRRDPVSGKLVPAEVSPTTLAKHLRHLAACLEAAVADGLLTTNPVRRLDRSSRPKAAKRRPSFFTDDELRRLWPELEKRPVYLNLCRLAVLTGLRHGELAALRWTDVRLLDGELEVRRQFTHGVEVDRTKDAEPRTVHLVPQARELLADWYAATGDEGLVFELEQGGHLDDSNTRKVLYRAMAKAGVPREGDSGRARTFHSFRHSFARVALEHGQSIQWVKDELGHSTITLTVDLYGSWSQAAARAEADKLAGAFAV